MHPRFKHKPCGKGSGGKGLENGEEEKRRREKGEQDFSRMRARLVGDGRRKEDSKRGCEVKITDLEVVSPSKQWKGKLRGHKQRLGKNSYSRIRELAENS